MNVCADEKDMRSVYAIYSNNRAVSPDQYSTPRVLTKSCPTSSSSGNATQISYDTFASPSRNARHTAYA
jgi:hypothetical protein